MKTMKSKFDVFNGIFSREFYGDVVKFEMNDFDIPSNNFLLTFWIPTIFFTMTTVSFLTILCKKYF